MLTTTKLIPLGVMARRLRVRVRWLRAEADAGKLPCVRAEKQLLFDPETIERLLLKRAAGDGGKAVPHAK